MKEFRTTMTSFGKVMDYTKELQRIKNCVISLRQKKQGNKTSWKTAAEWHLKYSNLNGKSVLALSITLSPTGCEWAKQGGCTMCGEFEGAFKEDSLVKEPQFHVAQFAASIGNKEIWNLARRERKEIKWLRILQEGNYTNTNEMHSEAMKLILQLGINIKGIERITIESRPQFLNEKIVKELVDIFKHSGVELEIGMGVEAQNDVVRNVCINKQCTHKQFESAVELLKKNNIASLAYILLKPPFLTEKEAIEEAVATAHYTSGIGFSRISFEPMTIHSYTLVDALAQCKQYRLPSLWSVIEVTKRCSDIASMFGIGGIGYYPLPKAYSISECSDEHNCNKSFSDAILHYNKNRDVKVFDKLACSCKKQWEKELEISDIPLKKRINLQLSKVESVISEYSAESATINSQVRNSRLLGSASQ